MAWAAGYVTTQFCAPPGTMAPSGWMRQSPLTIVTFAAPAAAAAIPRHGTAHFGSVIQRYFGAESVFLTAYCPRALLLLTADCGRVTAGIRAGTIHKPRRTTSAASGKMRERNPGPDTPGWTILEHRMRRGVIAQVRVRGLQTVLVADLDDLNGTLFFMTLTPRHAVCVVLLTRRGKSVLCNSAHCPSFVVL